MNLSRRKEFLGVNIYSSPHVLDFPHCQPGGLRPGINPLNKSTFKTTECVELNVPIPKPQEARVRAEQPAVPAGGAATSQSRVVDAYLT